MMPDALEETRRGLPRAREIELSELQTFAVFAGVVIWSVVTLWALWSADAGWFVTVSVTALLGMFLTGFVLRWGSEVGSSTPVVLVGRRVSEVSDDGE